MSNWGLSDIQIATIDAIVSIFESERPGDYGAVARDPNDAGGLSYGKHQAALTKGTLYRLLSQYCETEGALHAADFAPYMPRVKAGDRSLDTDKGIYNLLKTAAADPVMQKVQDAFFSASYMKPALDKWKSLGFSQALSAGVIYDSYIHSGGLNMAKRTIERAGEPTADNEKEWIRAYVAVRKEWLTANYPNTAVRMRTFEALAASEDKRAWALDLPLRVIRPHGSYPLTPYDLGAHLFGNAIRRMAADVFGLAKPGDASGANGRDRFIQQALAGLGYLSGTVDGVFGKGTATAVKAFQKDNGLPLTGAVDGDCFDKLCGELEEKGSTGERDVRDPDHGLVELPPEKRASATGVNTGAGVAAGAAGATGVTAAVVAGGNEEGAAPSAETAPAPAPQAETPPPAPAPAETTPAETVQPAAPETEQPATTADGQPAPASPPAPAEAPVQTAHPPAQTGTVALPPEEKSVSVGGMEVSVGVLTLAASALFLAAVFLFAMGRRKTY